MDDFFAARVSAEQRERAALIKRAVSIDAAAEALGLAPKGHARTRWQTAILCPLCRKSGSVRVIGEAWTARCCAASGDVISLARLDARFERFDAACDFLERLGAPAHDPGTEDLFGGDS